MVQGVAVAAELVGGANPGEKKSCYRGEKGGQERLVGGGRDFWVCSGAFEDEEALRDENT